MWPVIFSSNIVPSRGRAHFMYRQILYKCFPSPRAKREPNPCCQNFTKKKKMNPKSVEHKQLDRGQMVAKESNTGVIVGKWKDTRDVMSLTTKSVPTLVETPTRRVV